MRLKVSNLCALAVVAGALGGCADGPLEGGGADATSRRTVSDPVLGVELSYPERWSVVRDPYLFDTYGLTLVE
ncbi:MAG TPA: hypothetical protein VGR37_11670, partial [Longimicrobiaceae bacterium]|nr:hypothetical protein [Longimicrobiaceae bacterium]